MKTKTLGPKLLELHPTLLQALGYPMPKCLGQILKLLPVKAGLTSMKVSNVEQITIKIHQSIVRAKMNAIV